MPVAILEIGFSSLSDAYLSLRDRHAQTDPATYAGTHQCFYFSKRPSYFLTEMYI